MENKVPAKQPISFENNWVSSQTPDSLWSRTVNDLHISVLQFLDAKSLHSLRLTCRDDQRSTDEFIAGPNYPKTLTRSAMCFMRKELIMRHGQCLYCAEHDADLTTKCETHVGRVAALLGGFRSDIVDTSESVVAKSTPVSVEETDDWHDQRRMRFLFPVIITMDSKKWSDALYALKWCAQTLKCPSLLALFLPTSDALTQMMRVVSESQFYLEKVTIAMIQAAVRYGTDYTGAIVKSSLKEILTEVANRVMDSATAGIAVACFVLANRLVSKCRLPEELSSAYEVIQKSLTFTSRRDARKPGHYALTSYLTDLGLHKRIDIASTLQWFVCGKGAPAHIGADSISWNPTSLNPIPAHVALMAGMMQQAHARACGQANEKDVSMRRSTKDLSIPRL